MPSIRVYTNKIKGGESMKLNSKAFTVVEGLLAVIAISLVSFVGYYVYHAQTTATSTYQASTSVAASNTARHTKAQSSTPPVDPILYSDGDGTAYDIAVLATNADERQIAAAIAKTCTASDAKSTDHVFAAATGTKDLFTGKDANHNYRRVANTVVVNAGCYDKTLGGNQFGGGALHYLVKKNSGWVQLAAGQSQISCESVDNQGISVELVSTCYDEATQKERAPKS
jgi:Tfp pilus assembly protein PilV